MFIYSRIFWVIVTSFSMFSCSTDLNINAEPEDIWVVWGILNPQDTVQYIRISKGFLPEGDALVYAKENDLSAKGLQVTLINANKSFIAIETDSILKNPRDGTFYPYTTLYKIDTKGNNVLIPNEKYTLDVKRPDDSNFFLRASTFIPEQVSFNSPRIVRGPNGHCLLPINLNISYDVKFVPANGAAGYELRAFLDYEDNKVNKQVNFGPSSLFSRSVRCVGGGLICYQFRQRELVDILAAQMKPETNRAFEYGASEHLRCGATIGDLPKVFRLEVTAADSVLYNYVQANSPIFTDFNTVRLEYTNIESSERALGILGSISIEDIPATFDPCTEYLLGLRVEPPAPSCVR